MLGGGDIAAQNQVQFIQIGAATCDGSDGVVGFSIRESNNAGIQIGITTPCSEDLVRQICDPLGITTIEADNAHGPLDDTGMDVFITLEGDFVYIFDNENINVSDISSVCNTIDYEILYSISTRVERVFVK